MARSLTAIGATVTIDGVDGISDTEYPDADTVAVSGPLSIHVNNGTKPGDIRERTASFQLTFDPSNQSGIESLLEGSACSITIRFASWTLAFTRFFVSEVEWTPRPGRVTADVLVMGDNVRIKYEPRGQRTLMRPSMLSIDPQRVFRSQANGGAMQTPHSLVTYRENNRIGSAWLPTQTTAATWPTNITYAYGHVRDTGNDALDELLQFVAATVFARVYIDEGVFGFHVARFGGATPHEVPARYVAADRSIRYSVTELPNTFKYTWANGSPIRQVPEEVARFGEVAETVDFGDDVRSTNDAPAGVLDLFDFATISSLRPRIRWRLSDATVNLSRWADENTSDHVAIVQFLRAIFATPTATQTFIPSVTVPMSDSTTGLPSEAFGVVDQATLTLNPIRSPQPRAQLSLTLGTGDGQGLGTTMWSQLGQAWNHYQTPWETT